MTDESLRRLVLSTDVVAVEQISVSRWRRYGHDRLYVKDAAGVDLGWWDVASGQAHPRRPEYEPVLAQAASNWCQVPPSGGDQRVTTQARPEEPVTTQAALVAETPQWRDLARNAPGAEARAQAVALKEAEPVRTFLRRVLGVHCDERAWRTGADGEERVGAALGKLASKDSRWRILHAVPVGKRGSDIDHVVIGPGGVFTINTKNHPGAEVWVGKNTFLVNGQRQPYVRNSRHEAERAGRLLSTSCGFDVPVRGVIALVGASELTVKSMPVDVHVLWRGELGRWLRRRPELVSGAQVEAIHDMARRSTTWVPSVGLI